MNVTQPGENNPLREKYTYDGKNQLIRHDSATQGKSFAYKYDAGGNILSKSEYDYTTGELGAALHTVSYTYGDSSWGDLLTACNGQAISYDAIGNPTSYLGWNMTWQGRQLASAAKDGKSLSFTYDANGIRTSKTVNGVTTEYFLNGSQILAQKTGESTIWFFYDSEGNRIGMIRNGYAFYYMYNLQGDVIGLMDARNGRVVARYTYDAWGSCTVQNADGWTAGDANPFRYRGYYYDTETGLYYLNSRYYDSEVGRFISADNQIAGVGGEALGYNMFAYCMNNPGNMFDPSGNWPKWIKNTVKWVAKNIVKPFVKTVQKTLSKVDLTYSAGVNVSGTPSAWIFNGQIGVSMDTKGNVAIQASAGGGVSGGTPSISISSYRSITNAHSINELNGMGYQIGGSAIIPVEGVPVAVGGDFNIIRDLERNRTYYGGTLTGGLAAGAPGGEFHVEWGTTVTLPKTQFNIYDVARSVYIKIMEW